MQKVSMYRISPIYTHFRESIALLSLHLSIKAMTFCTYVLTQKFLWFHPKHNIFEGGERILVLT